MNLMLNQLDRGKLAKIAVAGGPLLIGCIMGSAIVADPLFGAVAMLAVAIGGLILMRPFWGVPITLFLGMCGDLQHFDAGLSIVKAFVLLMLVGFAAQVAFHKIRLRKTNLEFPLCIYAAVFALGYQRDFGSEWASAVTWLGYPIYFMLILQLVRTKRQVQWTIGAALLGAALASSVALLEWTGLDTSLFGPVSLLPSIADSGVSRSMGLAHDPNAGAYPMIIAVPLFLATAFSVRSKVLRFVLLGGAALGALGVATTFSRSGYLGVAVAVASLMLLLPLRKSILYLISCCTLALVILNVMPEYMLTQRFRQVEDNRTEQYVIALGLLADHPLVGAGQKAFTRQTDAEMGLSLEPHSNILSLVTNAGLIGLTIFAVFLVRYVRLVRRGMRRVPWCPLKFQAAGMIGALLGFQAQGLFIGNMGWFVIWGICAMPLCCLTSEHGWALRERILFTRIQEDLVVQP